MSLLSFYMYNLLFHVARARVLVMNERGELLLVRSWTGRNEWSLPGGGVQKGEAPERAAQRELEEEVGVLVPLEELRYVTTIVQQYEAVIYIATVPTTALPVVPHNRWEIMELAWFSPDGLPTNLSPLVALALKKLSK
jgi:8-oxo-dGTP pyrophosphatase MutT (NUDIX family)